MSIAASMRRITAVTRVRSLEFLRDRSSLGWNIVLPVVLVIGLAVLFSGEGKPLYKVAVVTEAQELSAELHPFLDTRYVDFYRAEDLQETLDKLTHHKVDMLIDLTGKRYWVNESSPKGYALDRMLQAEFGQGADLQRGAVQGEQIEYVDWLVPGILGMNMMFSCLFGVGYVIVRYRKNGYLKRLKATPLTAFEFLSAQVLSRLILIVSITVVIFVGTKWMLGLRMQGSYLDLFIVAVLGAVAMIAMGLTISSRVSSEELAGGLLNVLSWPMMFLSGVWFSLEGSSPWLQAVAEALPLTHLLSAARAIMLDGAALGDVLYQIMLLVVMAVFFMIVGAALFKWSAE